MNARDKQRKIVGKITQDLLEAHRASMLKHLPENTTEPEFIDYVLSSCGSLLATLMGTLQLKTNAIDIPATLEKLKQSVILYVENDRKMKHND